MFAATAVNVPTGSLYSGTIALGTLGWDSPKPNVDAMMANTNQNVTNWVTERGGYGVLDEKSTAVYGMVNFEKDALRGNVGLRYISTDVTAEGYKFDGTPLAPGASYQDQLNLFTLSSKQNANLVAYWENKVYSARLAYNWRSEYMTRETGWYGNRMHDAYGTLDLSLGWNVTDKVRIAFEATNLLKADDVQYGPAAANTTVKDPLKLGYPAWSFMGETTYKLSVSAKF